MPIPTDDFTSLHCGAAAPCLHPAQHAGSAGSPEPAGRAGGGRCNTSAAQRGGRRLGGRAPGAPTLLLDMRRSKSMTSRSSRSRPNSRHEASRYLRARRRESAGGGRPPLGGRQYGGARPHTPAPRLRPGPAPQKHPSLVASPPQRDSFRQATLAHSRSQSALWAGGGRRRARTGRPAAAGQPPGSVGAAHAGPTRGCQGGQGAERAAAHGGAPVRSGGRAAPTGRRARRHVGARRRAGARIWARTACCLCRGWCPKTTTPAAPRARCARARRTCPPC